MSKNNIMSLVKVRNKPSRDSYDLSKRISFTAKPGELHPIWWRNVLPGDKWEIDVNSFMRTAPVATASQGRLRYYYDFFFVPMEQLWQFFPEAITQMYDNKQHSNGLLKSQNPNLDGTLPSFTLSDMLSWMSGLDSVSSGFYKLNMFGFDRTLLCQRLMNYLYINKYDKGSTVSSDPNTPFSLFPLLAYQKIYADYFRYTQWETCNPSTFNVNFMTGNGDTELADYRSTLGSLEFIRNNSFFDMRYCNYQKDLFHGILPNSQFGEEAAVPLTLGDGSTTLTLNNLLLLASASGSQSSTANAPLTLDKAVSSSSAVSSAVSAGNRAGSTSGYSTVTGLSGDVSFSSLGGALPILALRQYQMFQKWKEVAQAAEEDYKAQIEAHWGVSVSSYLSGMVEYLGGVSGNVNVNEVVNQSLIDSEANIRGKGIDSSNGKIKFSFKGQYGILMCIYHCLPLLDYNTSMVNPEATLTHVEDYPIPELDSIGMEQLRSIYLSANTSVFPNNSLLGYVPRYAIFKTDVDQCYGAFCNSLKNWLLPFDDSDVLDISYEGLSPDDNPIIGSSSSYVRYQYFKVNPHIVDDMFASEMKDGSSTDPLWNWCYLNIRVVRNLDRNGLPY